MFCHSQYQLELQIQFQRKVELKLNKIYVSVSHFSQKKGIYCIFLLKYCLWDSFENISFALKTLGCAQSPSPGEMFYLCFMYCLERNSKSFWIYFIFRISVFCSVLTRKHHPRWFQSMLMSLWDVEHGGTYCICVIAIDWEQEMNWCPSITTLLTEYVIEYLISHTEDTLFGIHKPHWTEDRYNLLNSVYL